MINYIENLIKDKKVLILGFGREGKSTYNLIKKTSAYKELAISDQNPIIGISDKIYSGDRYLDAINDYDIVIKSPGVVIPKNIPLGNAKFTSQIELFLGKYRDKVIGVTGTKGKSTVASLIYHILKENGKDVLLAGNIGIPVFDVRNMIKDETTIVLELSCHQLENCRFSPSRAIFLNIYEEHLDHYADFNAYYDAKKNIYMHQKSTDILYCEIDVKPDAKDCHSHIEVIDKSILPFKSYEDIKECRLTGEHNLYNISYAYVIAKSYGIDDTSFIKSLCTFKPLPHRLEYIGEKDGIRYYDDSISTAVESTISAIKSVKNIGTILIGGLDRGINYEKLADFLSEGHVKNIICMYASGTNIYEKLLKKKLENINVTYCEDLYMALDTARNVTKSGEACVLSPAAASYGYFKNFEERGDKFKEYIFKE